MTPGPYSRAQTAVRLSLGSPQRLPVSGRGLRNLSELHKFFHPP
ncbi:hypothetical protein [Streptomyces orinoci]|uniref:Uncharacterized protein n=1 Tax=Streptomyces orinoci TaxID=67339 RepID=A0ABV3K861_STRON|nr:hypothetical protein [Streptomyces orinoci]